MGSRIALTGGIGAGKSFVAHELSRLGAVIIDADVLAREAVAPQTAGLEAVVDRFGEAVLKPDGSLDRARLGEIVFADAQARADLNAILHPRVRCRAAELETAAPADAIVVHVIPLLVEGGLTHSFETIWVVDLPTEVQINRLRNRNAFSEEEARARIDAQASRQERLAVASAVIDNSGPPERTRHRVEELWTALIS